MNEMNNEGFALGWDDEFTNEQQEFVLLPEGEYPFEVTQMERARYEVCWARSLRASASASGAKPSAPAGTRW